MELPASGQRDAGGSISLAVGQAPAPLRDNGVLSRLLLKKRRTSGLGHSENFALSVLIARYSLADAVNGQSAVGPFKTFQMRQANDRIGSKPVIRKVSRAYVLQR